MADTWAAVAQLRSSVRNSEPISSEDRPVCKIRMRTSLAFGGATSTSSILSSTPAPQHTAALHLMTFPAVSDMLRDGRNERSLDRGQVRSSLFYKQGSQNLSRKRVLRMGNAYLIGTHLMSASLQPPIIPYYLQSCKTKKCPSRIYTISVCVVIIRVFIGNAMLSSLRTDRRYCKAMLHLLTTHDHRPRHERQRRLLLCV